MKNFIELSNVCGNSEATETTVKLFNAMRPIEQDSKGKYIIRAIRPYKNGVIVRKVYVRY